MQQLLGAEIDEHRAWAEAVERVEREYPTEQHGQILKALASLDERHPYGGH